MDILASLVPWAGWVAAAILALCVLLAAARLRTAGAQAALHEESLVHCWHTCLDGLSSVLAQLRSLRRVLDTLASRTESQSLPPEMERLRENVRSEIESIERQLAEMAAAPDQEWLKMSLTWTPGLSEEPGPTGPTDPALQELEKLRQDHAALQQKYRDLREQFAGVRKEFDQMLSSKSPSQEKESP